MHYKYPKEYFYPVVTKKVSELDIVDCSYRKEENNQEDLIYQEIDEEFASSESESETHSEEN